MTTSVKITALNPIGANIAYTSLVPVVNMTGTPTTEKATAQVLGNLILNGAGGSYFPAAAQATLAGTVTTAAQPNITSVGTLTSLAVTGNVSSGNANLGNLVIANFFSGDGYLLSNLSSGSTIVNGTSNVRVAASGNVSISSGGTSNVVVVSTNSMTVVGNLTTATVKTVAVVFSALPSASTAGAGTRGFITDANNTTFGSQVDGGGANSIPVYSDGTNWYVG
jgi:hypothetical protein